VNFLKYHRKIFGVVSRLSALCSEFQCCSKTLCCNNGVRIAGPATNPHLQSASSREGRASSAAAIEMLNALVKHSKCMVYVPPCDENGISSFHETTVMCLILAGIRKDDGCSYGRSCVGENTKCICLRGGA
jgi:hypothetical protein